MALILSSWLPIFCGVATAIAAFAAAVRDDQPSTFEEWTLAGLAAAFFGAGIGFGAYVLQLLVLAGWPTFVWVIGGVLVVFYVATGLAFAAWELNSFSERPLRAAASALVMLFFWPLVVMLLGRAFADAED